MTGAIRLQGCMRCTRCDEPLPGTLYNTNDPVACPGCSALLKVEVYPALYSDPGNSHEVPKPVDGTEAGCFYHPKKQAFRVCSSCGRYLCALCDIEMAGKHLCPDCLTVKIQNGESDRLVTHRVLYDNIALSLAVVPMITFWLTIITAPMAFYMAVRHWRKPLSLLPRTRFRFVMALLLSGLQMAGWATMLIAMV